MHRFVLTCNLSVKFGLYKKTCERFACEKNACDEFRCKQFHQKLMMPIKVAKVGMLIFDAVGTVTKPKKLTKF